jgi:hypothetical protein
VQGHGDYLQHNDHNAYNTQAHEKYSDYEMENGSISELHKRTGEGARAIIRTTKDRAFGNNPFATIVAVLFIKVSASRTFNVVAIEVQNM